MTAVATVKGGLWPELGVDTLTQAQGTGAGRRRISQHFMKKGLRKHRELAETLNGVVAGSAALATNARVEASVELGGVRAIETEALVDRVSAAADVTVLTADFYSSLTSRTTFGATPVANGDGNPLGTR